jgi:mRNA-degrading endonuclease toxin of MazEF toxin-antitoxin module
MPAEKPRPKRGSIWFVRYPTDPPDKGPRPVLIVSIDARNQNDNADTVLLVPFTTNLRDVPTHLQLDPGETGLPHPCALAAENVTVVRKASLIPSRVPLKTLSQARLRQVASRVVVAMGFLD